MKKCYNTNKFNFLIMLVDSKIKKWQILILTYLTLCFINCQKKKLMQVQLYDYDFCNRRN